MFVDNHPYCHITPTKQHTKSIYALPFVQVSELPSRLSFCFYESDVTALYPF